MAGNTRLLEPGMAFSIEPGFYLPGPLRCPDRGHRRHTDDGVERLNLRPRDLTII